MADQTGSGGADSPQRNEYLPPDFYAAQITGSRETLARVLQEPALDFGCRPHAKLNLDGSATLQIYATEARIAELQAAGYQVERGENVSAIGRERQAEIGKGDRFEGGRIAPRGLGEKSGRDRKGGRA
ncbi:MAG: hypothetical protein AABM67_10845 [Acidobacteriota bacterium]